MTAVNKSNKNNNYLTLESLKFDEQSQIPFLHVYSQWQTQLAEWQ